MDFINKMRNESETPWFKYESGYTFYAYVPCENSSHVKCSDSNNCKRNKQTQESYLAMQLCKLKMRCQVKPS